MTKTKNSKTGKQHPLNITVLAHCLYPIAQPYAGGLEMITQLLCDELVARGHQVTLYAHHDSVTKATLRPYLSRETFETLLYPNEHESLGMSRDELYYYQLYQDAMREIITAYNDGHINVVHNHTLHHVPMLLGQAIGQSFLTTFHTPIFAHLRLALLTLQHGTQTQFTSVSQCQQRLYSEFVPSEVVYNGIEVDTFEPNIEPVDAEQYFWFGRICPEKGTHLAMDYCLKAGKKLVIAGPKSNIDYFEEKVAPLFAKDNAVNGENPLLNYVGHLTTEEVNSQLQNATAMLFTSTWEEPYGLTLAESLACGCPIIGFNVGAAPEIVTDKTGIIVDKFDAASFINAFDDVQMLSRQDCRTRAEQFCSAAVMVDGYLNQYYGALNKNGSVTDETKLKVS